MTSPAGARTSAGGDRLYRVGGVDMPSASTVTKVLNKPGLNVWLQKRIASGIANDDGLLQLARMGDTYKAVRQALDTAPSPEADLGTAVHLATEEYDLLGITQAATAQVQPFLDQWIKARAEFSIEPLHVERTVSHRHLEYAGTMDRAVWVGEWYRDTIHEHCQKAHILDVKTGKEVWPDVALQLAAYSHATDVLRMGDDGELEIEGPLEGVCSDVGIVAALHADACKVIPVDLRDAWPAFVAARDICRWEEVKKTALGKPLVGSSTLPPW